MLDQRWADMVDDEDSQSQQNAIARLLCGTDDSYQGAPLKEVNDMSLEIGLDSQNGRPIARPAGQPEREVGPVDFSHLVNVDLNQGQSLEQLSKEMFAKQKAQMRAKEGTDKRRSGPSLRGLESKTLREEDEEEVEEASRMPTVNEMPSSIDEVLSLEKNMTASKARSSTQAPSTQSSTQATDLKRHRDILVHKASPEYVYYCATVPRKERKLEDPETPQHNAGLSKRRHDGKVRKWKILLHDWEYDASQGKAPKPSEDVDVFVWSVKRRCDLVLAMPPEETDVFLKNLTKEERECVHILPEEFDSLKNRLRVLEEDMKEEGDE